MSFSSTTARSMYIKIYKTEQKKTCEKKEAYFFASLSPQWTNCEATRKFHMLMFVQLTLILTIPSVLGIIGINVYQKVSQEQFECLKG